MRSLALYQEDVLCPPRNFLAAEMHPFEIIEEGGYAEVKIVDPEEKMINYQGRLLMFGTQTAASGVLAISKAGYIGGNSLFAPRGVPLQT